VCLHKDSQDRKEIIFFSVDSARRAKYDAEYWSVNSLNWRLYHRYLDSLSDTEFPYVGPPFFPFHGAPYFRGSTFFYTYSEDNIAQSYQETVCHLPPLIDPTYRANHSITGYDHFLALHMHIVDANGTNLERDWTETQIRFVADSVQGLQSDRDLNLIDHGTWIGMGRPETMCFDELIVYQSASCLWYDERSPYPPTMNTTLQSHFGRLFQEHHLRTEVPCVQNITIYDRSNTSRRRMLNAYDLKLYLEHQARVYGLDLHVQVLSSITGHIFEQMHRTNGQEMWIEPHSASNYNMLWLPFNAVAVELGVHGSWYARGVGRYMPQTYKVMEWGTELVAYNKSLDNMEFAGERSFHVSRDLMQGIFNLTMYETKVSFCRLNK
jgi:hypothetical protein